MSDESLHEIQLNGKQLVFVFMAATVVAVVIFLCGVMVGRGVEGHAAGVGERASDPTAAAIRARPAAAPFTGALPLAPDETLTYAERLQAPPAAPEVLQEPLVPLQARVAPPVSDDRPPVPELAEPPGQGYAVQVGAYSDRSAAEIVARRLLTMGYPAFLSPVAPGGQPRFLVRVGKYDDRREAERVASRLEREEQFQPSITR